MKKNKILISILVLSLIINVAIVSFSIYERNRTTELSKVWNLAINNAEFLYQQYDEMDFPEAYTYAIGEIGTIFNSISFINYGENGKLTDNQKEEFCGFYLMLIDNEAFMKEHISEVREIIELLQAQEDDAFIKMKALCESIK
ncbi:hypothetical protein QA584_12310 [Anaerocolumna sp. AGMB13025]|uniref:hypothetical protein n=1 Tax=Anaerocolumna sp. AGMB13025 TaxID=3039116 RepID=UPI00241FB716|nr:hypothetical protein [Anaerocolumna sp. AGMB13025]WFR59828.1 hypothetical protein QA584_12310 [Anaerocolumna sp. AGMB13025]